MTSREGASCEGASREGASREGASREGASLLDQDFAGIRGPLNNIY
jgi:hypothetical protein